MHPGKPPRELKALIVSTSREEMKKLEGSLLKLGFTVETCSSIKQLREDLQVSGWRVILVDLDTIPADNLLFRQLKSLRPWLSIVALSRRSFHPELDEAIREHVCACLRKPLNPDELDYWLTSIARDDSASSD